MIIGKHNKTKFLSFRKYLNNIDVVYLNYHIVPLTEITLLEEGAEGVDGSTQIIEATAMVLTFMVTMMMLRVVQVIAEEIMALAEEVDFGPEWQLEGYLGICLEEIEEGK